MVLEKAASQLSASLLSASFWRSTRFRLTAVICAVAIIPLILCSLFLADLFELKLTEVREQRLQAMASYLAWQIQTFVPEALQWQTELDWQTLHDRIAPMTEAMVSPHQDTILGYYTGKDNAIIAYAPEIDYTHHLRQSLPPDAPVQMVYETKEPLLDRIETMSGPGLFYAQPLIADDRVIGHTFAIITLAELRQVLQAVWFGIGSVTLLLSLAIWVVATEISDRLTHAVDHIVQRIQLGGVQAVEMNSHIPELEPLVNQVERMTDELRQARQSSWDLLDTLPLGVLTYGPDQRLSFINATAAEILSLDKMTAVGETRATILTQSSLVDPLELSVFAEVSSGKLKAGYGLVQYRDRDGRQWPMHVLMLPVDNVNEGQRGVMIVLFDLRKEIGYEQLQGLFDQEMRKGQAILDTVDAGVVAVDHQGLLTTYNRAAGVLLGQDSKAIIGQPMQRLPEELQRILGIALGGQPHQDEISVTIAGEHKELMVNVVPLRSQGGAVAAFADMTLWNKLRQDSLRSDRLSLIGEMAAGTAHEIRNPLTALRGFLQLLQQRLAGKPELSAELEWIELMLSEADQINHVVTEFLQMARSKEHQFNIINPGRLVKTIFPVIQNECLLRDMLSQLELDPDLPMVTADVEQIKQVLLNIAQNAIQAMDKGGMITLAVRHQAATNQVAMAVTDQGCGIAQQDLKRIFNPFYTTKEAGTGLGLAICQRIVNDHHGQITVESELGVGTTFTVWLPAVAQDDAHPA